MNWVWCFMDQELWPRSERHPSCSDLLRISKTWCADTRVALLPCLRQRIRRSRRAEQPAGCEVWKRRSLMMPGGPTDPEFCCGRGGQGVLLHPTSHLVDHLGAEAHHMERVEHSDRLGAVMDGGR